MPVHVPRNFDESVKRLTLEIKEAERYLVFADLPSSTLEALSEAVDKLRATGWAVLNSLADQFSGDQQGAIVLTTNRVQRSISLISSLVEEIDAGRITPTTKDADKLRASLGVAYKKLHYAITGTRVPPEGV
jgi:hypothetical protein